MANRRDDAIDGVAKEDGHPQKHTRVLPRRRQAPDDPQHRFRTQIQLIVLDQDDAASRFAIGAEARQQFPAGRILRRAKLEVAVVARGDDADGTFAKRARPVEQNYCQLMRAPTRTVRGQPIDRSGVRAVSYSVSRMFSTAT